MIVSFADSIIYKTLLWGSIIMKEIRSIEEFNSNIKRVLITEEEIKAAEQIAATWNQYKYLKQRHLIVELRREQFTLRDSYVERHLRHSPPEPDLDPVHLDFEAEIPVFPLGLVDTPFSDLVFKPQCELNPYTYTEKELEKLAHYYWDKKSQSRPLLFFDF